MIMEKEDTHSLCTNNTKCEDNPFPVDSKSDLRKPATHPAPQARFSSRVLHNLEDNGAIEIEASSTRNRKKCYNTKCGNSGSLRKVKSRVEKSRYRYFCEACFLLYKGLQFCEFCEQIYGSGADEEEDLENWVGCDTCDRWNHISCEETARGIDSHTLRNLDNKYSCLGCLTGTHQDQLLCREGIRKRSHSLEEELAEENMSRRVQKAGIQTSRVEIVWRKEPFYLLELFLNNIQRQQKIGSSLELRLCLPDDLVKCDIERITKPLQEQRGSKL